MLHLIMNLTHASLSQIANAHSARLAVIETSCSREMRRVQLRWNAARGTETLLLSMAFLLCSHVCCLATASIWITLPLPLLVHATLLHHAFFTHAHILHAASLLHAISFMHPLLILMAALFIQASFVIHTKPVCLSKLLSLLMCVLLCNERLFVAHCIIATNSPLVHVSERAADGCIVCMMRMVLSLSRWCLREWGWWWRERGWLQRLRRGCPNLMLRLLWIL
jgi:hypothetical protein